MSVAGSMTISNNHAGTVDNPVETQTWYWTSSSGGAVSGQNTISLRGLLINVSFQPDVSAKQPTDGYNVTITDVAGIDVLNGQGAGLSQTTATRIVPAFTMTDGTTASIGPVLLRDDVSLNVSGAGDTKSGWVRVYLKRP